MTRKEDVWHCSKCGDEQGRHDMWFDEGVCGKCHTPETIGSIEEDGTIEKEYSGNGYIYKNYEAFQNKSKEVCYVSELDDDFMGYNVGWRYKDFLGLAKNFIKYNEDVQEYCNSNKITAHDMAVNIFESVDWQDPATLVNEWEQNATFTE